MKTSYIFFKRYLLTAISQRSLLVLTVAVVIISTIMLSQLVAEFNNSLRQQAMLQTEVTFYESIIIPYLQLLEALYLIITPLLLMRTISEEREHGTLELLLTLPINKYALVVGKWLSGVTIIFIPLIISLLPLLLIANMSGNEMLPICAGALGLLLQICLNISLIIFVSTLLKDGISIGGVSFILMYALFLLERYGAFVSPEFRLISFHLQLAPFFSGAIPLAGIFYFISYTIFFLISAAAFIAEGRHLR